MGRGPPRKWTATSRAPPPGIMIVHGDQWESDLDEYVKFCRIHHLDPGPKALTTYAQSQLMARMCPVAIANRVESFKHINHMNLESAKSAHRLKALVASLRKSKATAGGPKRKPLCKIDLLMEWCIDTGEHRDLVYQSYWYILIAVGCRPEELHTINWRVASDAFGVRYNGRKNEEASGANFLRYPFTWSAPPPRHIKDFLTSGDPLPKIGTRRNVAACFNSWLKKFHGRNHLKIPKAEVTSTCPRVRMDNVLRDQLDAQLLTTPVYERLIGHTVKVSDQSYRR